MNTLRFKQLSPDAVLPQQAMPGDAGYDLTATSDAEIVVRRGGTTYTATLDGTSEIAGGDPDESYGYLRYSTGIAVEIPEGSVGLVFPRSSISKTDMSLANAVGVIDAGYRGEITVVMRVTGDAVTGPHRQQEMQEKGYSMYKKGDRIAQLVVVPCLQLPAEFVDELSPSARSTNGWGSTDAPSTIITA